MTTGGSFRVKPDGGQLHDRTPELARIQHALEAAAAGRGGVVVVEGPAGIGKSALLGVARERARDAGLRVLRARGAELERDFAFGVVRQLFEPALATAPPQERAALLQGPAGRAAAQLELPGAARQGGDAPPQGPDAVFAALHGLYWLCANLAARGPLCLAIDDAHWADAPSLRFVTFLTGRLEELGVVLLLAARPESGAAQLVAALVTGGTTDVVRPGPLTDDGVAALLEEQLEATPAPEFVVAAREVTGATPFLVRELATAVKTDGFMPDAAAAARVAEIGSGTVARWILVRLGRLPEPAARLARGVALLERCSLAQAALLTGIDRDAGARAADALAAASVLRPGRPLEFVHPLVRSAVYGELSGAERAAGHRRAAELLAMDPNSEERAVEHLLAIEPAGDAWVVDRLVWSARAAARAGAPESAGTYLRRALAEPPPPAQRSRLLLECAVAEDQAGEPGTDVRLQAAVAAAQSNADRVSAAMLLGHVLARGERSRDAVKALDGAAALLDPPDEARAAMLEIAAVATGMIAADTAPAIDRRALALRARAEEDGGPPEALAIAAFVAAQHNEPAAVAGDLALHALASRPRKVPEPTDMPWFPPLIGALLWTERDDESEAVLDAAAAHALATADPALISTVAVHRAWLGLRRGHIAVVESEVGTLLESAVPVPLMYRLFVVAFLAEALVLKGSFAEAEQLLDEHAGIGGPSHAAAAVRIARGRLRVAQHRVEEGLTDLHAGGALIEATLLVGPGFLLWRADTAQAHLLAGDRAQARRLAAHEVAVARAFGAPRALGVALRAAGVVAGKDGEQELREAVALLEGGRAQLELALALTELGALLRRSNRRAESREPLRRALDLAYRAGAEPLAARADTELRAAGAKPRRVHLSGVEALTPSQRRVAQLAADGLTNREIAQTLFVTARTVESHLTHVFAKLDIDSRAALRTALA